MTATRSTAWYDDAQVVGHEDQRHAQRLLEAHDEAKDLGLDRHVERRGGLVGDEQARLAREGDGEHHALALAAGELMRVGVEPPLGVRDADLLQERDRPGRGGSRRRAAPR